MSDNALYNVTLEVTKQMLLILNNRSDATKLLALISQLINLRFPVLP